MQIKTQFLCGMWLLTCLSQVWADTAPSDDLARMQRQLNQEVLEKPFFAEDSAKVEAYIQEASKKQIKPLEYTGPNWRAGYTCQDMLRYSWVEYRNCRYYHHYYGRYYSYP